MRFKSLCLLVGMLAAVPTFCHAQPVVRAAVGANGIWFDALTPKPNDFELGGNVAASLQPHISLVGATYYGTEHGYLRGNAGIRFTASNVDDPNFSVGIGARYDLSSNEGVRPEGLTYDASLGYAWPDAPAIVLVVQGAYHVEADQASVIAGVRYQIGGNR